MIEFNALTFETLGATAAFCAAWRQIYLIAMAPTVSIVDWFGLKCLRSFAQLLWHELTGHKAHCQKQQVCFERLRLCKDKFHGEKHWNQNVVDYLSDAARDRFLQAGILVSAAREDFTWLQDVAGVDVVCKCTICFVSYAICSCSMCMYYSVFLCMRQVRFLCM